MRTTTRRAASAPGVVAAAGALVTAAAMPMTAAVGDPGTKTTLDPPCHPDNGVQHVISITFDA
jgi:hypothetical protein